MKATENDALITLESIQTADGESDKTEFTSECRYYVAKGASYITYKEHRSMGMGESTVFLKVEKDCITMRRMGEFHTVMVYKSGETTDFLYRVPFGVIEMKIMTEYIKTELSESGGTLEFGYKLFAGAGKTDNLIKIKVERK